MDRLRDDEQAGRGAPAELAAHQGERSRLVPEGGRAAGQFVQQHPLRRRQGRDRLSAPAIHAEARRPVRLHQAGRRQRSRDRLARAARARRDCRRSSSPPSGWIQNTNNWPWSAAGPDSPKQARLPALHGHGRRELRAALHAVRAARAHEGLHPRGPAGRRPSIRYLPAFAELMPAWSRPMTRCRRRSAEGEAGRADRGAARLGLSLGRGLGADLAGGVLGRALWAKVGAPTRPSADDRRSTSADEARARAQARGAGRGCRTGSTAISAPGGRPGARSTASSALDRRHRPAASTMPSPASRCAFTSAHWGSLASFGAQRYPGTKR